jgi:hypothetical protein
MSSIPNHIDNKFAIFKIVVIMTVIVTKYDIKVNG